jgi:hypothetical protein
VSERKGLGQVPWDSENRRTVGGGAGVAKHLAQFCGITKAVKMATLELVYCRLQNRLLWYGASLQNRLLWYGASLQKRLLWYGASLQKRLLWYGASLQNRLLCYGASLQKRLLWYDANLQTADVLQLKFRTKTSCEAAKTSPAAARSIPSHCSAVQDTSNAAVNCQDTVTVLCLTAS